MAKYVVIVNTLKYAIDFEYFFFLRLKTLDLFGSAFDGPKASQLKYNCGITLIRILILTFYQAIFLIQALRMIVLIRRILTRYIFIDL